MQRHFVAVVAVVEIVVQREEVDFVGLVAEAGIVEQGQEVEVVGTVGLDCGHVGRDS